MEPATTLYSTILLLGAAHGLFLALALINIKGGNAIAHRVLALLTLTLATDLGVDFLNESHYLVQFPRLVFVESVTSFLYGPLAYLYVHALTSKENFQFSGKKWGHFLPFVVGIALLTPFYNLSDAFLVDFIYNDADVDDRIGLWVIGGLIVQLLPIPLIGIYLVLSVRQVIRHGRNIRDHFSSIERISLVWLRNLLVVLGFLYAIYAIGMLFASFIDIQRIEVILNLSTVIVIYAMGYMGIRQPVIFSQNRIRSRPTNTRTEESTERIRDSEKKKYQKSALDAEMTSALLQELQHHMATETPFLDSSLTLAQLAEQLHISPNYLSQVINEQTGKSFFDYINQHRVAEAKRLFADANHAQTNILTVAMDAGFNSKSAFYTAFKQHTGGTPSQYRKSLAADS